MGKCEVCGRKVIGPDECAIYFEGHGEQPAEICAVCGKVLCHDCSGGRLRSDTRVVPDYLCPTHYAQVKEYIEGLKPKWFVPFKVVPSGYGDEPLVDHDANGAPFRVWVNGKKFVPEAEKPKLPRVQPELMGYTIATEHGDILVYKAEADALYDHMREEHDASQRACGH